MNKRKQQQQQQQDQLVVKRSRGYVKEADYYGNSYKVQERVAARATAKSKWTESLITQIREDGSFLLHVFGTSMSILILPNENTGRLMGKYSEFDVSFTQRRQVFLVPATRVFQIGQLWKLRGHRGDCEVVSKDNISVTFRHNDNLTTVLKGNDIFDGVTGCVNSDMEDNDEEEKKVVYSLVSDSEEEKEKEKKEEKKDLCKCGKLASECVCANLDCRLHLFQHREDSEYIAAYMSDECLCYEEENVVYHENHEMLSELKWRLDQKYEGRVSERIAVKDKDGDWYRGKVLEKISVEKGCKVHYMGFPKRHDEWIFDYWARVSPFMEHFEQLPEGEKDDLEPTKEFREFYSKLKEVRDWRKILPEEPESSCEEEEEAAEMKDYFFKECDCGPCQCEIWKKQEEEKKVQLEALFTRLEKKLEEEHGSSEPDEKEQEAQQKEKPEEEKTEMKLGEEVYKLDEEVDLKVSGVWSKAVIVGFERFAAVVKDLETGIKYPAVPENVIIYSMSTLLIRKKEEKKQPECSYCDQPGINYGNYNGMWRYACEEHDQRNNPKYTTNCNFELCASAKIIYDPTHKRFFCDNCLFFWWNICIDVCPHAAPAGTCNNKGVNANEKSYQIQAVNSVELQARVERYKKQSEATVRFQQEVAEIMEAAEKTSAKPVEKIESEEVAELVKPSESKEEIVSQVQDNELSCKDCVQSYYVDAYPNEHQRWRLCQHCFVMSIEEGVQFCKLVYKESRSNEMKQVFQVTNYVTKRNPEVGDIYSMRTNYRVAEVMVNHYFAVDLINGNKVMLRNGEFNSSDFINTQLKCLIQQTMNRTNLINLMLGTKQELFAVQWKKKLDPNTVQRDNRGSLSSTELLNRLEETRTVICSIPSRKGNTVDVFGHTLVHCWYDVTSEEFLEGNNRFKTITNQTVQWMLYKGTKYIATN